jgi:ABC-type antimicrobial peptide transport system permease subunit
MVLTESIRLVALGAMSGVPLALVLRRAASRLTYGIPPVDVMTILLAVSTLLGVAVVAALAPAVSAAAVDPVRTLRAD